MELLAQSDRGWVHFTSRLVHEETRPTVDLIAGRGTGRRVDICSQCRRIRTPSGWREVEEAVPWLHLYQSQELPALDEVVCGACVETVAAAVSHPDA